MVLAPRLGTVRRRSTGSTDWVLAGAALLASIIGLVMVYSATRSGLVVQGLSATYFLKRQAIFVFGGVILMAIIWRLDYRRLEQLSTPIYIGLMVLLLAVLAPGIGSNALGAQRWFSLGFIQIQPSEFAVLSIIIAVATYCNRRPDGLTLRDVSRLLIMAGVPMALILIQPDLGTVIIISITLLVMLAVAGLPGRLLIWLLIGAVVVVVVAIEGGVLSSYQIHRFTSFLNQNSTNPAVQQYIYNVKQAKTAIGSGGLLGSGIGHGALTNLGYVPEQQTDFIFTAVGEQTGFIGSTLVLCLLGLISYRILRAAMLARDMLGRVVCAGVFAFFTFSVFQNAGMTMGIMPVTGIPLPFLSYGGSAALVFFSAIGLVLAVEARRGG
jgi:rod shape determining protein RodA